MSVAIRVNGFPETSGTLTYDAMQAEMKIDGDPPEGLIFHWAGVVDGQWTINDVWESRAALDRFLEERIMPAVEKLSSGDPGDSQQPTITEFEVHNYVKP